MTLDEIKQLAEQGCYWRCDCGTWTIVLDDNTICCCVDVYDQEWVRHDLTGELVSGIDALLSLLDDCHEVISLASDFKPPIEQHLMEKAGELLPRLESREPLEVDDG